MPLLSQLSAFEGGQGSCRKPLAAHAARRSQRERCARQMHHGPPPDDAVCDALGSSGSATDHQQEASFLTCTTHMAVLEGPTQKEEVEEEHGGKLLRLLADSASEASQREERGRQGRKAQAVPPADQRQEAQQQDEEQQEVERVTLPSPSCWHQAEQQAKEEEEEEEKLPAAPVHWHQPQQQALQQQQKEEEMLPAAPFRWHQPQQEAQPQAQQQQEEEQEMLPAVPFRWHRRQQEAQQQEGVQVAEWPRKAWAQREEQQLTWWDHPLKRQQQPSGRPKLAWLDAICPESSERLQQASPTAPAPTAQQQQQQAALLKQQEQHHDCHQQLQPAMHQQIELLQQLLLAGRLPQPQAWPAAAAAQQPTTAAPQHASLALVPMPSGTAQPPTVAAHQAAQWPEQPAFQPSAEQLAEAQQAQRAVEAGTAAEPPEQLGKRKAQQQEGLPEPVRHKPCPTTPAISQDQMLRLWHLVAELSARQERLVETLPAQQLPAPAEPAQLAWGQHPLWPSLQAPLPVPVLARHDHPGSSNDFGLMGRDLGVQIEVWQHLLLSFHQQQPPQKQQAGTVVPLPQQQQQQPAVAQQAGTVVRPMARVASGHVGRDTHGHLKEGHVRGSFAQLLPALSERWKRGRS